MTRRFSLLVALLLMLFSLVPACAEDSPESALRELLGGTSWLSPEGWEYTFSGDGRLFFSSQMYPSYIRNGFGYVEIAAISADGSFIDPASPLYVFMRKGDSLLVMCAAPEGDTVTQTFTLIDHTAELAGTRWVNKHGDTFAFNEDCTTFSCSENAQFLSRTQSAAGSYYEMTIGPDGEMSYDPASPFAFRLENGQLLVYETTDGRSIFWQVFTPAAAE